MTTSKKIDYVSITTPWTFISHFDPDGKKDLVNHIVPTNLVSLFIQDINKRYPWAEIKEIKPIEKAWMDNGGMVMSNRTYQEIDLGNSLTMIIPTIDFELHLEYIKKLEKRFWGKVEHFKIFNAYNAVIVPYEEFEILIDKMEQMLFNVTILAKKEEKEFLDRLNTINAGQVRIISDRDPAVKARLNGKPFRENN